MASSSVHDPSILDVLSAGESISLDTELYRVVFEGIDPTVGSLSGGRWAPPQTYEVLYTSTSANCALAEVYFHLRRQPIFPRRKVEIHTLQVTTTNSIDLSDATICAQLGLDNEALTSLDYEKCRDVGHAAEFLGFDALLVKSARFDAENVVILLGNHKGDMITKECREVDWSKDV